jgi:potassium-transporting ATPase KdpC subunit
VTAQEVLIRDESQSAAPEGGIVEHAHAITGLREQIRPALVGIVLLTLLTGIVFPLVLAAVAVPLFPHQAGGSLTSRGGVTIGSELIGQRSYWPGDFFPRPSAAGRGYDATASGGTNLGPANPKLLDGAKGSIDGSTPPFVGVWQLAVGYRRINGLSPNVPVPIDAVTRSGSGLDPHISEANADLQVPRVARERRISEETVRRLVAYHTSGRQLGFLGEPRVAVLPLNLALDQIAPPSASSRRLFP